MLEPTQNVEAAKQSTDEPKTILKRIDVSIARFPQFKTQLETIKKDWTAKMQASAEPVHSDNILPALTAQNTPTPENAFRDGVVTSVYPDGVTVSSSSSLTKIHFADMTPEEKARFNYDPIKEKEYLDGLEKTRKASSERKRIEEEQDARDKWLRKNGKKLALEVIQVLPHGVLADQMETKAGRGSYMSSIGGGGGAPIAYDAPSGKIIFVEGVKGVVDGQHKNILAAQEGTYTYRDVQGANRTVEKWTIIEE